MQLFTFSDLKTKLQNDYDMTDENFISDPELAGYINDAIDDSETAIHNLHHEDKYFLTSDTLTLVSGTADYAPPTDIYGNKIRLMFYQNGSRKYRIDRVRNLITVQYIEAGEDYQYLFVNNTSGGVKQRLYPTPAESGAYITRWYIRNMKRVTTSLADATNVCEVPECINFVTQHVKHSMSKKTRNPTLIASEKGDLQIQYNLMMEALKDMTADENNLIPQDLQHYYDSDSYFWLGR